MGARTGLSRAICAAGFLFVSLSASAAVEDGINYLLTQQRTDGAIATLSDIATPAQATAESLLVIDDSAAQVAATEFLASGDLEQAPTEYLARLAKVSATPTVITELAERRTTDGLYGAFRSEPGNVLDTAFALRALPDLPREPRS